MTTTGGQITIRRAWRSQLKRFAIYIILCGASVALSRYFPGSVLTGKLFPLGERVVFLTLPLFTLLPLMALGSLIYPIYDSVLYVSGRGVEMKRGILSLQQKIIRLRFEDIRSIEMDQTLYERALNLGTIGIGSAATGMVEIILDGIATPKETQDLIQSERDRRVRSIVTPDQPIQAVAGD